MKKEMTREQIKECADKLALTSSDTSVEKTYETEIEDIKVKFKVSVIWIGGGHLGDGMANLTCTVEDKDKNTGLSTFDLLKRGEEGIAEYVGQPAEDRIEMLYCFAMANLLDPQTYPPKHFTFKYADRSAFHQIISNHKIK